MTFHIEYQCPTCLIFWEDEEAKFDTQLSKCSLCQKDCEPYEVRECSHDDHEDGVCLLCGDDIGMTYDMEHDSGDMER